MANDTDSSEELPAELDPQEQPQPEKLPDLRKKSKKELQELCLQLGMARDEMERMERWSLVKYVKNNARDELSNLYREHKQNQQEQNKQFQEQVKVQFEDQRNWLSGREQFILTANTLPFSNLFDSLVPNAPRIEPLRAPTELNDVTLPDFVVPGMEKPLPVPQPSGILPTVSNSVTGALTEEGTKRVGTGMVGPNGLPLWVRRVTLTVQKDGRILSNVSYTHSAKDVRNVLEAQRKLESLSLAESIYWSGLSLVVLHRYNGFDPSSQPIHKVTKSVPRAHKPRSIATQRVGI